MKLFTVSFFGHRIVPEFREAEERVEALIHTLLLENEYVEFLVGRNGDFDQIVTSVVKRQQRRVRDDNSALIWILPYPTAELRLVVFYVDHSSGGAYQTLRYAQRKNKDHLNLLHTLGEPRENSSDAFVWRSTAPERIIY